MKHIFYLITIAFIIYEISWILSPKEKVEKTKKYFNENKKNKGKKWDECSEEYKHLLKTRGVWSFLVTLWLFVGLFTFNWVAFVAFILFNLLIIAPISKLFRFSTAYLVIHWINSVIGVLFGVFILINSYHLKINLLSIVSTWINL